MKRHDDMNNNDILNELFEGYFKLLQNYSKLNGRKQSSYETGSIVIKSYCDDDEKTLKAMRLNIADEEISRVIRNSHITCYKKAIKKAKNYGLSNEKELSLIQSFNESINDIQTYSLDELINDCRWWLNLTSAKDVSEDDKRGLLYLHYAFDEYKQQKYHCCCSDLDNIKNLYKGKFDKQSSFIKYGLLPIDESRELLCLDPPRIYDKSIEKTIYLKNIPIILAKKFIELLSERKETV